MSTIWIHWSKLVCKKAWKLDSTSITLMWKVRSSCDISVLMLELPKWSRRYSNAQAAHWKWVHDTFIPCKINTHNKIYNFSSAKLSSRINKIALWLFSICKFIKLIVVSDTEDTKNLYSGRSCSRRMNIFNSNICKLVLVKPPQELTYALYKLSTCLSILSCINSSKIRMESSNIV